jgi:hypothetical protein
MVETIDSPQGLKSAENPAMSDASEPATIRPMSISSDSS